nr:hypothetical protein [Bacteroidales bacterium]
YSAANPIRTITAVDPVVAIAGLHDIGSAQCIDRVVARTAIDHIAEEHQIVEIRELIKKIGREKTVILSSHILAEVEATCDRIMIINKGKIVADGTAEELRKHAQGKEILRVTIEDADVDTIHSELKNLGNVEMVDIVNKNHNVFEIQSKQNTSSRRDIFRLCVKNNWVLTELMPLETKLEDIFRELTIN